MWNLYFNHTPKETIPIIYQAEVNEKVYTYAAFDPKTGLTKIGRSTNVENRMIYLSNEYKSELVLIKVFHYDVESELHEFYKEERVGGEWFRLNRSQLFKLVSE